MTPNLTTLYLINSTLTHSKEFATFHGWTGEGKAGDYAKGVLAEVIKSSIIRSREEQAQKTAKESVVEPAIT